MAQVELRMVSQNEWWAVVVNARQQKIPYNPRKKYGRRLLEVNAPRQKNAYELRKESAQIGNPEKPYEEIRNPKLGER